MLKKLMVLIVLAATLSLGGATTAKAVSIVNGENANFGATETSDGSLYIAGSVVTVAGIVDGDLYCAGQTVEVTGTVKGDVICAGQQVRIAGTVNGDVRVAGQTVDIDSKTGGSITAFSQNFHLTGQADVNRDATVFGQNVVINGHIGRDLLGGGSMLTVDSVVGRDVQVYVENLTLGAKAAIAGNLTYTSNNTANILQGATVAGGTQRETPPQKAGGETRGTLASRASVALYWFLAMLLVGTVLMLVKPSVLDATTERTIKQPWVVVGCGLIAVFAVPLLAVVLFLTIIGIPLMLILLLAWVLVLAVSVVFSGHALGQVIIRQGGTKLAGFRLRFASLALGLFLVGIASLVPVINTIVGLLAVIFGSGSILFSLRNNKPVAKLAAAKGAKA